MTREAAMLLLLLAFAAAAMLFHQVAKKAIAQHRSASRAVVAEMW